MTTPRAVGHEPATLSEVRVAVADDDPMIRRTIAAIIEFEDDLQLVGVAEHTPGAVHLALAADVLVADVRMPGGGAIQAARELREAGSHATVVALTGYDAPGDREQMTEAGVVATLVKGCAIEDIVETIRTAAKATQASRAGSRRFSTTASTWRRDLGSSASCASSA
jgi:DNA-binding NarL/FixJ family response regulator